MRKVFILLSSIIISMMLLYGRNTLFSDLEKHVDIMNSALYSPNIDVGNKSVFKWEIGKNDWKGNYGVLNLYLTFKRTPELKEKELWKREFELDIRLNAKAVTENGVTSQRLIQNYFFPTNEPIKGKTKLWSGWGDEGAEVMVGNLMRFSKEDLLIELTIIKPDLILAKCSPRLKVSMIYDPAVSGHLPLLQMIANFLLIFGLGATVFLAYQGWPPKKNDGEIPGTDK